MCVGSSPHCWQKLTACLVRREYVRGNSHSRGWTFALVLLTAAAMVKHFMRCTKKHIFTIDSHLKDGTRLVLKRNLIFSYAHIPLWVCIPGWGWLLNKGVQYVQQTCHCFFSMELNQMRLLNDQLVP